MNAGVVRGNQDRALGPRSFDPAVGLETHASAPPRAVDRRQGTKVPWLSVVGWVAAACGLVLCLMMQPPVPDGDPGRNLAARQQPNALIALLTRSVAPPVAERPTNR